MIVDGSEKTPRTRRGLRWLLIGSLALNLLVAGVVGGAVIGHFAGGDGRRPPEHFGTPYMRALSFEDKRTLGRAIRQAYRGAEIDRKADRRSYERVVALLRADPLDVAALSEEAARQDASTIDRRALAQEAWLALVAKMSAEERAGYADRLDEALRHFGRMPRAGRDGS